MSKKTEDLVNHPSHYNHGKFEVYEVIKDWRLNYNLGNVVLYIGRHRHKGNALQDLKKARWYLDQEIKALAGDEPIGCEGTE